MKAAVNEVLKGRPLNVVAREFNIDQMTFKSTTINKFFQQKMKNLPQVIYYLHQK